MTTWNLTQRSPREQNVDISINIGTLRGTRTVLDDIPSDSAIVRDNWTAPSTPQPDPREMTDAELEAQPWAERFLLHDPRDREELCLMNAIFYAGCCARVSGAELRLESHDHSRKVEVLCDRVPQVLKLAEGLDDGGKGLWLVVDSSRKGKTKKA